MNRRLLAVVLLPVAVLATGCTRVAGDDPAAASSAGPHAVTIDLHDDGCEVTPSSISSGPTNFTVTNVDANTVTEAELIENGRIRGEKENLVPGTRGTFSYNLQPGTYSIYCPGARTENVAFTATGEAAPRPTGQAAVAATLKESTAGYKDFVQAQVRQLVPATRAFTDAVRAGDAERAKALYGPARVFYERIEPVAESFGDLDPRIDARIGDVTDPAEWSGFHRLEKALWQDGSLAGTTVYADQLDRDVAALDTLVQDPELEFQPADLANGATSLMEEVATSKITGEEEAYSHLDLTDFFANADGAKRTYDLMAQAVRQLDPTLAGRVEAAFAATNQVLAQYKQGTGYRPYDELSSAQVKELSDGVNGLSELLSKIPPLVAPYK